MINKQKAADFAEFWKGRGDEKSETQRFWISLLQNVLDIPDATSFIEFEKRVQLTHVSFIDAYIPSTKVLIEQTAQAILDARALYPECSLADLYDETTMPPELRKAHQANDRAVMEAYGFNLNMTESECVAELMKLYQQLTNC